MTPMQWRNWGLALAGTFFDGFVVFMTGVALELIVRDFHIGATEKCIVSAASLAGILLGAILLGGWSDDFGRKRMLIAEMIILCGFPSLLLLTTDFLSRAICLSGLAMALGCDDPTARTIISESIPGSARGTLVLGAFAFQAVGALVATLNPDVRLPSEPIVPVRRADASGDTFVFTRFLDFSTQRWENAVGHGTAVPCPALAGELTGDGNAGILKKLAAAPYSIGYPGVSFQDAVAQTGLGTAAHKNRAGHFLRPTPDTVSTAASALDQRSPADERLSLVIAPGANSHPLINYDYAVVSTRQPDSQAASAILHFLLSSIALDVGIASKCRGAAHFIPSPDFISALSEMQIDRVRQRAHDSIACPRPRPLARGTMCTGTRCRAADATKGLTTGRSSGLRCRPPLGPSATSRRIRWRPVAWDRAPKAAAASVNSVIRDMQKSWSDVRPSQAPQHFSA